MNKYFLGKHLSFIMMFINVGVDVLIGALPQSCFMMNGSPYLAVIKLKAILGWIAMRYPSVKNN